MTEVSSRVSTTMQLLRSMASSRAGLFGLLLPTLGLLSWTPYIILAYIGSDLGEHEWPKEHTGATVDSFRATARTQEGKAVLRKHEFNQSITCDWSLLVCGNGLLVCFVL